MKRHLANSFEFDPAKPFCIEYGVYPHRKSGMKQVVDAASADAISGLIAAAQAAGAPGLPVYVGHPDVPDLAPKYPDKTAHGWIVSLQKDATGFMLQPEWVDAPAPGEFIYFSPYFLGTDQSKTSTHIDEMRSVGLTNRPNSTKFRLPNEAGDAEDDYTVNADKGGSSRPSDKGTTHMTKILALLGLLETATEDEAVTALNAIIAERDDLKRKQEESKAETEAANTALDSTKKDLANERDSRIGLMLDCALRDGKVTPATKPVWEGRLKRDFANESDALAKTCAGIKTKTELPNEAGASTDNSILAKYDAMPSGPDKRKFLNENADAIHKARKGARQ
jgi:hypothetical protein